MISSPLISRDRESVTFIVPDAMMIGLLAICLVAYAFVPAESGDTNASNTSSSHTVVSEASTANSSNLSYSFSTNTVSVSSAG